MTEESSPGTRAAGVGPQPWLVPASYAQERIWFASQLAPEAVYQVVDQFELRYPVGAADVAAALSTVCQRHETLRTSLMVRDGQIVQAVWPRIDPPLDRLDLAHLPGPAQQDRLEELFDGLAGTPIPLDRAPLWRATLVRLGPAAWALLLVVHHAVFDAASAANLRAEVTELCAAAAQRRPADLPELAIQYADFAVWQRQQLAGDRMAELMSFWRRELAGLPAGQALPADLRRPAERSFAGAHIIFGLPGTAQAAAALARRHSATPFMVMFATYAALLHRLSGAADIVVGLPVGGRDRPELQPLIGMFVNVIVIRLDAGGDPAFTELLARVRRALLAAWEHQDMPFQTLAGQFPRRDPAVPPLYQLSFNYLDVGFSRSAPVTEDDMALEILGEQVRLEYNTALFTEPTARRIADGYRRVLSAVLENPGVRLAELPVPGLAPEPDRRQPPDEPREPSGGPGTAGPRAPFIAPRTAAEELVAQVWAEVLGTDQAGAASDFFDLGGHSLLALRVIARLCAVTGTELTIQSFFADTTVAGVAAELERLLSAELADMPEDEAARLAAGEE